jgi:hypothetical protein
MSKPLNHQRRRFFGLAAGIAAATKFGFVGTANAQTKGAVQIPAVKPGTNTSFAPLKQLA